MNNSFAEKRRDLDVTLEEDTNTEKLDMQSNGSLVAWE